MREPDRIQSDIEILVDGSGAVSVTLMYGNGDRAMCSCATASVEDIKKAVQMALKNAYIVGDLLPSQPEVEGE